MKAFTPPTPRSVIELTATKQIVHYQCWHHHTKLQQVIGQWVSEEAKHWERKQGANVPEENRQDAQNPDSPKNRTRLSSVDRKGGTQKGGQSGKGGGKPRDDCAKGVGKDSKGGKGQSDDNQWNTNSWSQNDWNDWSNNNWESSSNWNNDWNGASSSRGKGASTSASKGGKGKRQW